MELIHIIYLNMVLKLIKPFLQLLDATANMWGKCKTVSQMAGIIFALLSYALISDFGIGGEAFADVCNIIISVLFWISAVLCIISGAIYLFSSKEYIDPAK